MFGVEVSNEISFGEALTLLGGLLAFLGTCLYRCYSWWISTKPLTLHGTLDPYDIPPILELDRRLVRHIQLAPGDTDVELCVTSKVPWQTNYIDVRFVNKKYRWLWLPPNWIPTVNALTAAVVTNISMLTTDGTEPGRHQIKCGTSGDCRLD